MQFMQVGRAEKPRPLDDPTRPYIRFDIVAHLDSLSSHEGIKRVRAGCSCILVTIHCMQTVVNQKPVVSYSQAAS